MRITYLSRATEDVATVAITETSLFLFRQKKRDPKSVEEAVESLIIPVKDWDDIVAAFRGMVQHHHSGRKWTPRNDIVVGEFICQPFSETKKIWDVGSQFSGSVFLYNTEVEHFLYCLIPKVNLKKNEVDTSFTLDTPADIERREEKERITIGGISYRREEELEKGLAVFGHRNRTPREDDGLDEYIKHMICENRHTGTSKYWVRGEDKPPDPFTGEKGQISVSCSVCGYTRILHYELKEAS